MGVFGSAHPLLTLLNRFPCKIPVSYAGFIRAWIFTNCNCPWIIIYCSYLIFLKLARPWILQGVGDVLAAKGVCHPSFLCIFFFFFWKMMNWQLFSFHLLKTFVCRIKLRNWVKYKSTVSYLQSMTSLNYGCVFCLESQKTDGNRILTGTTNFAIFLLLNLEAWNSAGVYKI